MPPTTPDNQTFLDLGAAEITFKTDVLGKTSANPNGGTHGGVGVSLSTPSADVMRDALGANIHDGVYTGLLLKLTANLTGLSINQFSKIIPGSSLVGGSNKGLLLSTPVGLTKRELAGLVTVKPIRRGVVSTNAAEWIRLFEAAPELNFDFQFDFEKQKVYAVTFTALVRASDSALGCFGNNTT